MAALPAAAREAEDLGLRTVDPRRSADLSIHRGPGVHERGHDGEGPISEGLLGAIRHSACHMWGFGMEETALPHCGRSCWGRPVVPDWQFIVGRLTSLDLESI